MVEPEKHRIQRELFSSKIGVVGFGVSGKHITLALTKLGIKPIVFEKKGLDEVEGKELVKKLMKEKEVEFVFNYTDDDLKKADVLILSSGIKPDAFLKYEFISELDFVCSFLNEYIFITGTKGKGTTLFFTGAVFRRAGIEHFLGGNIGEGEFYSPSARAIDFKDKLAILEVSSFQLKSTRYASPLIHAITNLGIDHLDWHRDIHDYWTSKVKMCERAKVCVFPYEIEETARSLSRWSGSSFIIGKDIKLEDGYVVTKEGRKFEFDVVSFSSVFPGEHNISNLLLALGIYLKYCDEKNIPVVDKVLEDFASYVPKRRYVLEFEGEYSIRAAGGGIRKVRFYNDSLSTNPLSLSSAIRALGDPSKIIVICGGLAKGFDFSSIEEVLRKVKSGIVIGVSAQILARSFSRSVMCKDLEDAIERAIEISEDGDIVLFSPGCASFDMFRSARERGAIFSSKLKEVLLRLETK